MISTPLHPGFGAPLGHAFPMAPSAIPINPTATESTLYVGNLSPVTDESRLHTLFQSYGNLTSTKIMRDLYNSESRRFGFVSFQSVEEAQRAKEALNYQKLDGFEIRICFKKLTSDFKEGANLFVKNIDKNVTTRQLDELFSEFGKIVSCSIRTNIKGESLGYGYVQFESEEAAEAAKEKLNGSTRLGSPIAVEKFVSSKNRTTPKNNLYLKNFPKGWNGEKARGFLDGVTSSLGKVNSMGVYEHKMTGGDVHLYAFIAFEQPEDARKFIEQWNGKHLEGAAEDEPVFYVGFAESKAQRQLRLKKEYAATRNTTNLFVKSLLETVTDEQLKEVFGKFGVITSLLSRSAAPPFLPNGQTLKYAFINYKTADEASNALLNAKKDQAVKDLIHPIHKKNVEFIGYFQNKTARAEYNRMRARLWQATALGMMPGQMGMGMGMGMGMAFGGFKKNQAMMPMGFNPMMMGMGMPFGQKMMPHPAMMGRPGAMSAQTPPTVKNSQSSSTSRQGEDEEVFSVEYLKTHKDEFMTFDKDRQNNILGNLMYHKVVESGLASKELAPKITGMLIDLDILDISEIIEIMENKESLIERINEALEVINSNED